MRQENRRRRPTRRPELPVRGFRYGDPTADAEAHRHFGEGLCDVRGQLFVWAYLLAELTQCAASANAGAVRNSQAKMAFAWQHFPEDAERNRARLAAWKPLSVGCSPKRITLTTSRGEWPDQKQFTVEFALDESLDIQVRELGFTVDAVTKPIIRRAASLDDARSIAQSYARVAVGRFAALMDVLGQGTAA